MPFEHGNVTCTLFYVARDLPANLAEAFAREAAPPLDTLGEEALSGWVGGRHLLDLPVTEENAWYGGHLRLYLVRAERKVPPSLFRAHCAMEELALMRAENRPFLNRKERMAIRQEVIARLLPQMPPTISGAPFVAAPRDRFLYLGTASVRQAEVFAVQFHRTTGVELIPVQAATAAAQRKRIDVRDWPPSSFSPDLPDHAEDPSPGRDFLTWLWFDSESRGGISQVEGVGRVAHQIEGPLYFAREGEGAQEVVLRRGSPTLSAEARTCLLAGKKLRQARLMVARQDETWQATFDADGFTVRNLKLPVEEEKGLDPVSRFQDRMIRIGAFRDTLLGLFDRFLAERNDGATWARTVSDIRTWASERQARA